ncbi:VTT domain-containing protein [Halobacillus rhizosphaerae]|uniref:VTT domain-containing protein n=1 Tax=Halobacillus rhizosphaerae TaxID=3064889 RepID=UPI00398BBBAE
MHILEWVNQYGYIVLFASLFLELMALPIPTELLMTYIGFLSFQGEMNLYAAILIAFLGSSAGMSLTYWIGQKVGITFFEKYGAKFHFGPERLHKTSRWFQKYGQKTIIFAYFIPGLRHLTGYFSGITKVSFKTYMVFAYTGALIWVGSFITIGQILGPQWEEYQGDLKLYLLFIVLGAAVVLFLYQLIKQQGDKILVFGIDLFKRVLPYLPTVNRIRVVFALLAALFIGSFALMIGLIQDYMGNEFGRFNQITKMIIDSILTDGFIPLLQFIEGMAAHQFLLIIFVSGLALIWFKHMKEEKMDILFGMIIISGGFLLEKALPLFFTLIKEYAHLGSGSTFPSEVTLISIIVYGWFAYVILVRIQHKWIKTSITSLLVLLLFLIGIGRVYLHMQSPGSLAAGYVFGLVWLSLCIGAKEMLHLLTYLKVES